MARLLPAQPAPITDDTKSATESAGRRATQPSLPAIRELWRSPLLQGPTEELPESLAFKLSTLHKR